MSKFKPISVEAVLNDVTVVGLSHIVVMGRDHSGEIQMWSNYDSIVTGQIIKKALDRYPLPLFDMPETTDAETPEISPEGSEDD